MVGLGSAPRRPLLSPELSEGMREIRSRGPLCCLLAPLLGREMLNRSFCCETGPGDSPLWSLNGLQEIKLVPRRAQGGSTGGGHSPVSDPCLSGSPPVHTAWQTVGGSTAPLSNLQPPPPPTPLQRPGDPEVLAIQRRDAGPSVSCLFRQNGCGFFGGGWTDGWMDAGMGK